MRRLCTLLTALGLSVSAVSTPTVSLRAATGGNAAAFTPVPCADRSWTDDDPSFAPLPDAQALSGRYEGGLYRIETPANWNGELVLWAHGLVGANGPQGSRLAVGVPGGGPLREHLITGGFAWAASSYRCNGIVPGVGLLDTMSLIDVFTRSSNGRKPSRVYLVGESMGGNVTILGLQEFPNAFAGGLAMCASGPDVMDFLTAVGAASDLITGVTVRNSTSDQDISLLTNALGRPPDLTTAGRQLASVQIEISGGARPFAMEGLASRLVENVRFAATIAETAVWKAVATNAGLNYHIDERLGLSADAINKRVRRRIADADARSPHGLYTEAIAFDGRIERPLLTLHGTGDLLVPISLERTLKRAVARARKEQFLVQRIMRIAGHCGFSQQEQATAFDDLITWVHEGKRPAGDDVLHDLRDAGLTFTSPLRPGDPGTRQP